MGIYGTNQKGLFFSAQGYPQGEVYNNDAPGENTRPKASHSRE